MVISAEKITARSKKIKEQVGNKIKKPNSLSGLMLAVKNNKK